MVLDQQVILNNDGTFYINGNRLGDDTIITNTIYNTIGQLEKRIKALEDKINNNNNSNKKYKIVMGE